jgi:hypothetical protein
MRVQIVRVSDAMLRLVVALPTSAERVPGQIDVQHGALTATRCAE